MKTILIIDDDRILHEYIGGLLRDEGYGVLSAFDAFRGLELLDQQQVDLALLDVKMPGMDGLEMLSRLRKAHKDVPVIIMTGIATAETAVSALRSQACDFLAKPFQVEDLLSAVRRAVELIPPRITIEVLSARPEWIELRVPCDPAAVEPLERIMAQLKTDLPSSTRENITFAFREMLRNAIEHGGRSDPSQFVEVAYVRSPRMILYRIKDPGTGFEPGILPHAASEDPQADSTRHQRVRQELGMRPGGFGILLARKMVDELMYNERHNEVILIKYLGQTGIVRN